MRLTADEWAIAQQVCTPKQLQALDLYRRGAGRRRIAIALGITPAAVRDRIDAALLNIEKHLHLTPSDA